MNAVGIDGCRAGWLFIGIDDDGSVVFGTAGTLTALWKQCSRASVVLIDIPIGLSEKDGRPCDGEARRLLGKRAASIFSPPCRKALAAETYSEACRINQAATGKKLTLQTWHILPKIRETDRFLSGNPKARKIFAESHPEICFQALSGGQPMTHSKKTEKGIAERLDALKAHFDPAGTVFKAVRQRYLKKEVADDDIADALALAVTASRPEVMRFSLPRQPEKDSRGLPMRIVYASEHRLRPVSRTAERKSGGTAEDCLFCRWVRSNTPVAKLGSVAAFEDGHPVTPGHLLIVPLRHTPDCFSMNEKEIRNSHALIRRLAEKMKKADDTITGFNIGVNCGESAGQTVFHAHIHLIPRRDGDSDNPRGGVRGVIDGKRSY